MEDTQKRLKIPFKFSIFISQLYVPFVRQAARMQDLLSLHPLLHISCIRQGRHRFAGEGPRGVHDQVAWPGRCPSSADPSPDEIGNKPERSK